MISPKIYINAIAKNEEHNVAEFITNTQDADGVYILDTGSEDNTGELLKQGGVKVLEAVIEPFNFASARNMVLHYTPDDARLVIWMDMDDRLEDGWRQKLETILTNNPNAHSVFFNFSYDTVNVSHRQLKAFRPSSYKWLYPIHEVQSFTDQTEEYRINSDILITQASTEKATAVGRWLPLYNDMDTKWQNNQRMWFYYGRDLMNAGKYEEAIAAFNRSVNLTESYWIEQVFWAFLYKSDCLIESTWVYDERELQNNINRVLDPIWSAISIHPSSEVYYRMASLYHWCGLWTISAGYAELSINAEKPSNFLFNEFNLENAHRICSSCYTKIEAYKLGAYHVGHAVALNQSQDNLSDLQFYIDKGIIQTQEVSKDTGAQNVKDNKENKVETEVEGCETVE